jgi:DNA-binding transcriptional MerR regulator
MTSTSKAQTASAVCDLLGIKPSTLRAWRNRELVVIEGAATRNGWTRYTPADVAKLQQFAALVGAGVRPSVASVSIYGAR